jgi:hypothetical protein
MVYYQAIYRPAGLLGSLGVIDIATNEVCYLIRRVPALERSACRYMIEALSGYVSRKTIGKVYSRR